MLDCFLCNNSITIFIGIGTLLYILKMCLHRGKYMKSTRIDGKIVIITGANTGIGKANATDLAKRGGKIYIACRDDKRGNDALRDIKKESGSNQVYFMQLDLASMRSIREFSKKFHKEEKRLDILINNAGLFMYKRMLTEDGFEMHFGVNHLGHFLLTHLLLDLLKVACSARIINVSSVGHKFAEINRDDLMSENSYSVTNAYCQSKTANILFSHEMAKKLKDTSVTVNSCHPGVVNTEVQRHANKFIYNYIFVPLGTLFVKSPMEGAQTQIRLAVDPELQNVTGKYFDSCKEAKPAKYAIDDEIAEWLYKKSIELVGL